MREKPPCTGSPHAINLTMPSVRRCHCRNATLAVLLAVYLFVALSLHHLANLRENENVLQGSHALLQLSRSSIPNYYFLGSKKNRTRNYEQFEAVEGRGQEIRPISSAPTRQTTTDAGLSVEVPVNKHQKEKPKKTNSTAAQNDPILSFYQGGNWDGAPIVIEKKKLIFFSQPKIASTVFKQLFRRMMGLEDWMLHKEPHIPHDPAKNGLKYLLHFHPKDARAMMESPEWTRAIFVRDPQERVLSAYLDKAARKDGMYVYKHCCIDDPERTCAKQASKSFQDFLELISEECCCDPHWKPQSQRMKEPFWKNINFVGRFDAIAQDTKRLLQRVDAWEEYGASGWGEHRNASIFAESTGARHRTSADQKLLAYYNSSAIEDLVKAFYREDYVHPVLKLSNRKIFQGQ